MIVRVVVDLRVVVLVPFRHLVVTVVVIDLYGSVVLFVVLSVHLVHCNGDRLTVLSVLCAEIVLAFWIPLVVLLMHVLGIVYPHLLMCVHCLAVLILLAVQIVIPFVQPVVVLHCRH